MLKIVIVVPSRGFGRGPAEPVFRLRIRTHCGRQIDSAGIALAEKAYMLFKPDVAVHN